MDEEICEVKAESWDIMAAEEKEMHGVLTQFVLVRRLTRRCVTHAATGAGRQTRQRAVGSQL